MIWVHVIMCGGVEVLKMGTSVSFDSVVQQIQSDTLSRYTMHGAIFDILFLVHSTPRGWAHNTKSLLHSVQPLMGLHHYYTLHRLSVQIEVPSRVSISKKKLVCLNKFGMIFFRRMFSTTYLKMR